MTDFAEYTAQASTGLEDSLHQAHDINVATIDVLRNLTSVLVPMSVNALPNADTLVPAIDTAVARGYDALLQAVESQYDFAFKALGQLNSFRTA
jgi:hypothetical protein